jgi:TolB-like protein
VLPELESGASGAAERTSTPGSRISAQTSAASVVATTASPENKRPYKLIGVIAGIAAVALVALAAIFWFLKQRPPVPVAASQKTVAVLPLQNLGADKDLDYLRFALADEIATSLSFVPSLSIRPFATTSKYDSPTQDLQEAGRAMHVTDLITGHYLKEGPQLQITLEAIDIENNRTLWRDTMTVAAPDMIAMRGQVTSKIRQGLLPALGAGADSAEGSTRPKNEEAYDLYLRSIAIPHDPQPNKEAIAMLERAVGLDPTYAPAWGALGPRYYYDSAYSDGGPAMLQRSNAAYERALALDPNLVSAASELVTNHVESGDLITAYKDAKALVERHPENAMGHWALSYVLRYGGAIEHSARECNTALSLDPGNYRFRSCTFTFDQLGDYQRALDFLQFDPESLWTSSNLVRHYLRAGDVARARAVGKNASEFFQACFENPSAANTDAMANQSAAGFIADPDPEVSYVVAANFVFCGHNDLALRMIKSSITRGYCAYPGLQNDSMWAKLRGTPEFSELLPAAKKCQSDFLAQISQPGQ